MRPTHFPILLAIACGGADQQAAVSGEAPTGAAAEAPRGAKAAPIAIDGSSTVFPITEAVAEEFQAKDRSRRVTIGVSGTGGGMKKFCAGELAITGASRPIKPSEVEACKAEGIDWIELPVAYDGIALVVNKDAGWVETVKVDELKAMWAPEAQGTVTRWNQVNPAWPDAELHLFGPGVDSGTYDYFTHAIVGVEHSSRGDFTSSEDDNVLVQGVAGDKNALGFFGLAYYLENQGRLKALAVDDGSGKGVVASVASVSDGSYQPLSRPIFIYVSTQHADRPEVVDFVEFYLTEGKALVSEVGYVPLSDEAYGLIRKRFEDRTTGSLFGGEGSRIGASIEGTLKGG